MMHIDNDNREIRGSKFVVIPTDDGYVHVVWDEGTKVAEDDALSVVRTVREVADGQRVRLLIDIRQMNSVERSARNRFGNADLVKAAALVVETALSRTLGNFYIGLTHKRFPTKLFTDEDKAIDWLLGDDRSSVAH